MLRHVVSVWYRYKRISHHGFTVFITFLLTMIPTGCGTRATSSPSVTPGATGKPTEQGPGPWLYRVTIWGWEYWQYLCRISSGLNMFSCFSMLIFQGIYSHTIDPTHRRGSSQPDLLNVKAQRDASGWLAQIYSLQIHEYMKRVIFIQWPAD